MQILHGPRGRIHSLAFAPDGRSLAAAAGRSHIVWVWNTASARLEYEVTHLRRVTGVEYAPGGSQQLVLRDNIGVTFMDGPRSADHFLLREPLASGWSMPLAVALSPDGNWLATNVAPSDHFPYPSYRIALWDLQRDDIDDIFPREASCLAFAPNSGMLATGNFARSHDVTLWDIAARAPIVHLTHGHKVHHLAFAPDGSRLAAAGPDGLVKLWDLATMRKIGTLKGAGPLLRALAFAPDGRTLATASGDGTVRLWDINALRCRAAFDWQIGAVHAVALSPDGPRAAAGGDGQIALWDIDDWSA